MGMLLHDFEIVRDYTLPFHCIAFHSVVDHRHSGPCTSGNALVVMAVVTE